MSDKRKVKIEFICESSEEHSWESLRDFIDYLRIQIYTEIGDFGSRIYQFKISVPNINRKTRDDQEWEIVHYQSELGYPHDIKI